VRCAGLRGAKQSGGQYSAPRLVQSDAAKRRGWLGAGGGEAVCECGGVSFGAKFCHRNGGKIRAHKGVDSGGRGFKTKTQSRALCEGYTGTWRHGWEGNAHMRHPLVTRSASPSNPSDPPSITKDYNISP